MWRCGDTEKGIFMHGGENFSSGLPPALEPPASEPPASDPSLLPPCTSVATRLEQRAALP